VNGEQFHKAVKFEAALKEFLEKWEAGRAYDPRKSMEQFT